MKHAMHFGDDAVTLGAIGIAAYILADVTREAIGHGGACLANGGQIVLLTSVYFRCEPATRIAAAGGPVANLFAAALLWLTLPSHRHLAPHKRLHGYRADWAPEKITLLVDERHCRGVSQQEMAARVSHARNWVMEMICEMRAVKPARPCHRELQTPRSFESLQPQSVKRLHKSLGVSPNNRFEATFPLRGHVPPT